MQFALRNAREGKKDATTRTTKRATEALYDAHSTRSTRHSTHSIRSNYKHTMPSTKQPVRDGSTRRDARCAMRDGRWAMGRSESIHRMMACTSGDAALSRPRCVRLTPRGRGRVSRCFEPRCGVVTPSTRARTSCSREIRGSTRAAR